MSPRLAYRLALLAYPSAYRAARGDEILATLMDAHANAATADVREVISLVADGLRRRARGRPVKGVAAWRSGALLGAHLLALLNATVALLGLLLEQRLSGSAATRAIAATKA